jgi:hypothetical protein
MMDARTIADYLTRRIVADKHGTGMAWVRTRTGLSFEVWSASDLGALELTTVSGEAMVVPDAVEAFGFSGDGSAPASMTYLQRTDL